MKEVIMQVPSFSADYPKAPICVAELVRCAECVFKYTDRCPMDEVYLGGINADDFCSYGEREGE